MSSRGCPRARQARQRLARLVKGSSKARLRLVFRGPSQTRRDGLVGPSMLLGTSMGTLLDPQGHPDTTLAVTSSRQSNVTISHFSLHLSLSLSLKRITAPPRNFLCARARARGRREVGGDDGAIGGCQRQVGVEGEREREVGGSVGGGWWVGTWKSLAFWHSGCTHAHGR